MRAISCRVSLLAVALTALLSSAAAWSSPVASKPIPEPTADQFIESVAHLEAQPDGDLTITLRPILINWMNSHHPNPQGSALCRVQMPLVSAAQVGDDLASILYMQNQLEMASYHLQHPQASPQDIQAAALTGTLRMYLNIKKKDPKAVNEFADTVLASIKANGVATVNAYTCAGAPLSPATP